MHMPVPTLCTQRVPIDFNGIAQDGVTKRSRVAVAVQDFQYDLKRRKATNWW